jgi:outer membrane protein OmpA-like peptidoglycan-associated protein
MNMMPFGDYEAIARVDSITDHGVQIEISSQSPSAAAGLGTGANTSTSASFQSLDSERTVLAQDLASAHEIYLYFSNHDPKIFPGTTSGGVSREVFNELRTKGEVPLTYRVQTMQGAASRLIDKLTQDNGNLNFQGLTSIPMTAINCTLRRASPNDVAFPVVLDNRRVELPAIDSVCKSDQDEFDLYLLDDPNNPMVLWSGSKLGHFRGQVIRISFPTEESDNPIEQDLKQNGRAQVYGIYFDFASAKIRPQSAPVLQDIAKAMKDNPSWKPSIEGHTDSIGDAASNHDLSKRRAAAVKQVLVTQYHAAADCFVTAGFGASHPVDSNDTIEGRARNRRVELVRQ